MPPPLIALQAPSGTGKTTLMSGMIAAMHAAGLRVGALKHAGHAHPLDKPGSDSHRYRAAGAVRSAVMNSHTLAIFGAPPPGGPRALSALLFPDADLVLAEGWRGHGLPAVRLARETGPPWHDWTTPDPVVAWATDRATSPDGTPALPIDQPEAVARWLCAHLGVTWPG